MNSWVSESNQEHLKDTMSSELARELSNINNTCLSIFNNEEDKENHNVLHNIHADILSVTNYSQVIDEDDEWIHRLADEMSRIPSRFTWGSERVVKCFFSETKIASKDNRMKAINFVTKFVHRHGTKSHMASNFLDYAWESSWFTDLPTLRKREKWLMNYLEHHDKCFKRFKHVYKDISYGVGGAYDQLENKIQSLYHIGVVLKDKFLVRMAFLLSLLVFADVSIEQLLTRKWRDLCERHTDENVNLSGKLLLDETYVYELNLTDNGLDEAFV
jgi:hypothetical protein